MFYWARATGVPDGVREAHVAIILLEHGPQVRIRIQIKARNRRDTSRWSRDAKKYIKKIKRTIV
jgi:hypothetical protein